MRNIFLWSGRLLLGGIFIYAALHKIVAPSAFATDIARYHLLPHPLTIALSLFLPWLELFCGVGVICRRREQGALFLIAVMGGIFFVALASAWFRGLDINCGCFGQGTAPSVLSLALARTGLLGLLALVLFKQTAPSAAAP